jgi:hypothetical protein
MSSPIGYCLLPHNAVSKEVMILCAENFNNFYGIWQDKDKGRVKMGAKMLRKQFLSTDQTFLVVAFEGGCQENIIAHVFCKKFSSSSVGNGRVCWITQLVVKMGFRGKKVAQNLIHVAMGTDTVCAGLVSTHPHAVLALERAAKSKCDPAIIAQLATSLFSDSCVEYLQNNNNIICNGLDCLVDTKFAVDHAEPLAALKDIDDVNWQLGRDLPDQHEFIAIVMVRKFGSAVIETW